MTKPGNGPATCGEGLADQSRIPATIAELMAATAHVLEVHDTALDLADPSARAEHEVYASVAQAYRQAATELAALAKTMAGSRDLPMGRHDLAVMSSTRAVEAFERFVTAEGSLAALLGDAVEKDRLMLAEMRAARPTLA